MRFDGTHPTKNIGPVRFTSTGMPLQALSHNFNEQIAAKPLNSQNKLSITDEELSYIMKSELLPPLASGNDNKNSYGGDRMDESTKMMIERLERDSREREERYHRDAQERESRYREELKEREERIISAIHEIKSDIKEMKADYKEEFKSFQTNIETKITAIDTKVDNTYKHISSITIATISFAGAAILALAAIVVAFWLK